MASAREHLKNTHGAEQSHWNAFAKGLGELGTEVRAMHKEAGMKDECKVGDACDKLSALAQSHANFHGEQVEACMKAASNDQLDKLVPTNVSAVRPTLPDGIRQVPRYGTPLQQQPTVPLEFAKMFSVEDEE